MAFVNVVTSDRGWILEQLAEQLRSRLPYIRYSNGIDPNAEIQYYITYSSRRRRISPVEVGYFAHLEAEGEAHANFFRQAEEVDYCICHARLYANMLREHGIANVTAISPGVDLERFAPKLRIGVVGRTYHTGRKGEHLVAQLRDLPEIEWSFTGEGWPGEALKLPDTAMADFYRHLDYVLVPALYEGGPMCVVEALASGTPVIAPAVGWVPEFPHVEFEVNDVESLRSVLLALIEEKRVRRAKVLDRTWDNWAESHDRVFQQLAHARGWTLSPPAQTISERGPSRVGLFLHGGEGASPGGPTVRVPRLAKELSDFGAAAKVVRYPAGAMADFDLAHVFNAWAPKSALDTIRSATRSGLPTVFSPIFLDLSLRDLWQNELPKIFDRAADDVQLSAELAVFEEQVKTARANPRGADPEPGYYASVRSMMKLSDAAIFLSERERDRLAAIGADVSRGTIVHNPIDATLYGEANPQLFIDEYGLRDFVLCVARQESRKNQLMLMRALADTGVPLVLIGHEASPDYVALMRRYSGDNVHMVGRLPPNSPMLASAYAASRVATLPSWSEGAPLSALEAAASGACLVLSDASGESEYFGALARYIDPASVSSIREQILGAYETPRNVDDAAAQKAYVAERFGWDRHREATASVYRAIYSARARTVAAGEDAPPPAKVRGPIDIVFDVTTSANHKGRWTGIARVETALALALHDDPDVASLRFVAWNDHIRKFVEVPFAAVRSGTTPSVLAHYNHEVAPRPLTLPPGAHYIVGGSGWMQNARYVEALVTFKFHHDLRLCPIIHDVIPTRFPFWFNDGYAQVFDRNLKTLLSNADTVLSVSEHTKKDIAAFASAAEHVFLPPIEVFREGDEIAQIPALCDLSPVTSILDDKRFVLTVGAIHTRKNHKLLYDVWVQLRERMGDKCPVLVIVGGVAWNGEDVARAFREDRRINDRVMILEEINDESLSWLYEKCIFTVYPSLYEGWGLPVSESLRHGKLCIASSASSVPEIAPLLVELVDPFDAAKWLAIIQHYTQSRRSLEAREAAIHAEFQPTTWNEAARSVVALLKKPVGPVDERAYVNGTVGSLADRDFAVGVKRGGWLLTERWGCWSNEIDARLTFRLTECFEADAILMVEAHAVQHRDAERDVEIIVLGVPLARWKLRDGFAVHYVRIPAAIIAGKEIVEVVFRNAQLLAIASVKGNDDPRVVGIGVGRIALGEAKAVAHCSRYLRVSPGDRGEISLGTAYDFIRGGSAARRLLEGQWDQNSAWGAFTTGSLRLNLVIQDSPNDDLQIELALRPVATSAAPLGLVVLVNGEETLSVEFRDDRACTINVPVSRDLRVTDVVTIDLILAHPQGPDALGLGATAQPLGLALRSLRAMSVGQVATVPAIAYRPGEQLMIGTAPGRKWIALSADWHGVESSGVWSMTPRATIRLSLPAPPPGALLLVADIRALAGPDEVVDVTLTINGSYVGRATLPALGGQVRVPIAASAAGRAPLLELGFAVPEVNSPFQRQIGKDERQLGIRVSSLMLAPIGYVEMNVPIAFGAIEGDDRSAAFLRGGWYDAEPNGRWTRADQGGISLYTGEQRGMRLFGIVRVRGASAEDPVIIDLIENGSVIDGWIFHNDELHLAEFAGFATATMSRPATEITLRRRPHASDRLQIDDPRKLGAMVTTLIAVPDDDADGASCRARELLLASGASFSGIVDHVDASQHDASSPVTLDDTTWTVVAELGLSQGVELTLDDGWLAPEPDGVWSGKENAKIQLPAIAAGQDRLVELDLRVFGSAAAGGAEVRIGTLQDELSFFLGDDEFHRINVAVAAGAGTALTVVRVAPVSPEMLGVIGDARLLGVMLRGIRISARQLPAHDAEAKVDIVTEMALDEATQKAEPQLTIADLGLDGEEEMELTSGEG